MSKELKNYILEEFNYNNTQHKNTIDTLHKDPDCKNFLGNLYDNIQIIERRHQENINNNFYIIYDKKNHDPLGIIALTGKENDNFKIDWEIYCGIIKEKRINSQGENLHHGPKVTSELVNNIFSPYPIGIPEIKEIYLNIDTTNEHSKKSIKRLDGDKFKVNANNNTTKVILKKEKK